ncbi:MAG: hypothetical protein PUD22_10250, partial [Erysipelotrichaceae bacterium]|nr:hypothetical protein [Erysipelotrichaceae bacterium]
LCYAMQNLSDMFICAHIHDEVVIECPMDMPVDSVCDVMARVPSWADGLVLKAEGFESSFYKKE